MRRFHLLAVPLASLIAHPVATQAQDVAPPGWAVGASVGLLSAKPDLGDREYGLGFQGTLSYTKPSGLQIAGGALYGVLNTEQSEDHRNVVFVFVEPRYVILMSAESVTPYVGVRGGYGWQQLRVAGDTSTAEASADGWLFSGIIGVLARLSPAVALEATGVFGVSGWGNPEIGGEPIPERTGKTAWTGGIIVGFVFHAGS
ncbi:MAG: outer membrane beta-barrel protein [Gemmatimonadota bacterium]|nr:MAG: outer membrane beta-barrel protein [Gemmatimonadota bacterium]